MSPRRVSENVMREVPLLLETAPVRSAVEQLLATGQVALPVVDEQQRYVGVFGEQ